MNTEGTTAQRCATNWGCRGREVRIGVTRPILACLSVAAILVAALSAECLAEEPKSQLELLQDANNYEKFIASANEFLTLMKAATAGKRSACVMAFGNMTFCDCIAEKTPVDVDFSGYIGLVTKTREELNYQQLDERNKQIVDHTYAARESCVAATQ